MDKLLCQLLSFLAQNCEFWKSSSIVEILAVLQVLDLKWRLLPGVGGFLVGVLLGIFVLHLFLFDSLNFFSPFSINSMRAILTIHMSF